MSSRYTVVIDEGLKKEFISCFNNKDIPLYLKQTSVIEGYMRFFIKKIRQLQNTNTVKLDFLYDGKGEPISNEIRNTEAGLL